MVGTTEAISPNRVRLFAKGGLGYCHSSTTLGWCVHNSHPKASDRSWLILLSGHISISMTPSSTHSFGYLRCWVRIVISACFKRASYSLLRLDSVRPVFVSSYYWTCSFNNQKRSTLLSSHYRWCYSGSSRLINWVRASATILWSRYSLTPSPVIYQVVEFTL